MQHTHNAEMSTMQDQLQQRMEAQVLNPISVLVFEVFEV